MSDIEESNHSSATSTSDKHSSSNNSSSYDDSSTSGSTTTNQTGSESELVSRETKHVKRSKICFLFLLLAVTAAAGTLTYMWASNEEQRDFEDEFFDIVHEIDVASNMSAQHVAEFLNSVSISLSSIAQAQNTTWPNFVAPNFEVQAEHFRDATSADFLILAPMVNAQNRTTWEDFSVANQGWVQDGLDFEGNSLPDGTNISPRIHNMHYTSYDDHHPRYLPVWQASPIPKDISLINFDALLNPIINQSFDYIYEHNEEMFSEIMDLASFDNFFQFESDEHPRSLMMTPVRRSVGHIDSGNDEVVALLLTTTRWEVFFSNAIHGGIQGLIIVVSNSCGDIFTYEVNGASATFLGFGDLHTGEHDEPHAWVNFEPFAWHTEEDDNSTVNCHYSFDVYSSAKMQEQMFTNKPQIMTAIVVAVFIFTSVAFLLYDRLVQIRQNKIMDSARKSNAIVSSLFPAEVRDRLLNKGRGKRKKNSKKANDKAKAVVAALNDGSKVRLKNYLHGGSTDDDAKKGDDDKNDMDPIADLFPNTTVMFADIAGFTAWSSVREPSQVFKLLETVYRSFDHIAKRRRVFKVETIGDCYVAVTGLPEPREDHAVLIARFARDCLSKMNEVTKKLEESLGPETGDLTMRFGLHSGPVTAGVLRGEKSRFQLFGDTVNTAARMEALGEPNRIHISSETAEELRKAGKDDWIMRRQDCVVAKGKGELRTYWLTPSSRHNNRRGLSGESNNTVCDATEVTEDSSDEHHTHHDSHSDGAAVDDPEDSPGKRHFSMSHVEAKLAKEKEKEKRMVHWISELMLRYLKLVVAGRPNVNTKGTPQERNAVRQLEAEISKKQDDDDNFAVLDEVQDFVPLPDHVLDEVTVYANLENVVIEPEIKDQMESFISSIASMYRSNPFHNFEHAGHVTMSVSKLLSRIIALDNPIHEGKVYDPRLSVEDRTYGITSDKLKQFTILFCGLIHDVDHQGVPNYVLAKEDERLNVIYKGQAIAEQNSVEMAWDILMSPQYEKLRDCIYTTPLELRRFRMCIVNTIVATDIFDVDLAKHRRNRWEHCFGDAATEIKSLEDVSKKASVVVEYIIQASDVAHTMQHWQIYQKFNRRLYNEMYKAYREGRTTKDPTDNWYSSELGFFDNYVIPLAKRLKYCGVFGVSSDEYLNYARQNRHEWAQKGEKIVNDMKENVKNDITGFSSEIP